MVTHQTRQQELRSLDCGHLATENNWHIRDPMDVHESRQGHQRCNKTYGSSTCTEEEVSFCTADGDSSTLVFALKIKLGPSHLYNLLVPEWRQCALHSVRECANLLLQLGASGMCLSPVLMNVKCSTNLGANISQCLRSRTGRCKW